MKLAFTTSGENLDPSFGRARSFLIYDRATQAFEVISNQQNLDAAQGAGVKAFNTDALTRYRAGQLSKAAAAKVGGHWA